MGQRIGDATVYLSADTRQFIIAMTKATQQIQTVGKVTATTAANMAQNSAKVGVAAKTMATTTAAQTVKMAAAVKQANASINQSSSGITASFFSIRSALYSMGAITVVRGLENVILQVEKINRTMKYAMGSTEAAAAEMEFIRSVTQSLGLDTGVAAQEYVKLASASKGTRLEGKETRRLFSAISKASVVLGMSNYELAGSFRAVQQMVSKGKVAAEELRRQLGDHLPGAFKTMAAALGVTTSELDKMLSTGQLMSEDVLPKFSAELEKMVSKDAVGAVGSLQVALGKTGAQWYETKELMADSLVSQFMIDSVNAMATSLKGLNKAAKDVRNFLTGDKPLEGANPGADLDPGKVARGQAVTVAQTRGEKYLRQLDEINAKIKEKEKMFSGAYAFVAGVTGSINKDPVLIELRKERDLIETKLAIAITTHEQTAVAYEKAIKGFDSQMESVFGRVSRSVLTPMAVGGFHSSFLAIQEEALKGIANIAVKSKRPIEDLATDETQALQEWLSKNNDVNTKFFKANAKQRAKDHDKKMADFMTEKAQVLKMEESKTDKLIREYKRLVDFEKNAKEMAAAGYITMTQAETNAIRDKKQELKEMFKAEMTGAEEKEKALKKLSAKMDSLSTHYLPKQEKIQDQLDEFIAGWKQAGIEEERAVRVIEAMKKAIIDMDDALDPEQKASKRKATSLIDHYMTEAEKYKEEIKDLSEALKLPKDALSDSQRALATETIKRIKEKLALTEEEGDTKERRDMKALQDRMKSLSDRFLPQQEKIQDLMDEYVLSWEKAGIKEEKALRVIEAMKKSIIDLDEALNPEQKVIKRRVVGMLDSQQTQEQKLREQLKELEAAKQLPDSALTKDQKERLGVSIEHVKGQMALISAEGSKMEDALKENIRAFGEQFGETLSDMVMEGELKFSTIRKMFLDMVAKTIMKFFFQKWINAGMKSVGIPGFANGGLASGLSVVGEKGPELVNFGSGASRVYSNSQSRQMVNKVSKNSQDLRPLSITLHVGEGVNAAAEQTVRNMIPYIGREVIGIVRDDQRRKGAA